jgi:hypothetical protein
VHGVVGAEAHGDEHGRRGVVQRKHVLQQGRRVRRVVPAVPARRVALTPGCQRLSEDRSGLSSVGVVTAKERGEKWLASTPSLPTQDDVGVALVHVLQRRAEAPLAERLLRDGVAEQHDPGAKGPRRGRGRDFLGVGSRASHTKRRGDCGGERGKGALPRAVAGDVRVADGAVEDGEHGGCKSVVQVSAHRHGRLTDCCF